jgi:hypothetical protein
MIKVEFMQIAEKAILDKASNNLSLINIISVFPAMGFPTFVPQLAFAMRTKRDVSVDPAEIELLVEAQQGLATLFAYKAKIDYQDKDSNNLVMTVNGLVIPKPEALVFTCKQGETVLETLEIEVRHIKPEVKEEKQASV